MKRLTYFDDFSDIGWPSTSELAPYFLTAEGRRQFFALGNDSWGLDAEGADGTDRLQANHGRIDIHLNIIGHPEFGIFLNYRKWGGTQKHTYYSKGELSRLRELVDTVHGDRIPLGLYIPFDTAWKAIKEFIETDGRLPTSIAWIAGKELPADAFPPP